MKDYKIISWHKDKVQKEVNSLLKEGYITDSFGVYDKNNVFQTVFKAGSIQEELNNKS